MNAISNIYDFKNLKNLHEKNIYQNIMIFLTKNEARSKNTRISYEKNIKMFFEVIRQGTSLEELTVEDLKLNLATITQYQSYLISQGYKNTTINQSIDSVRSLYKFLKGNQINVNLEVFSLLDNLPDDSVNVGFLSPDDTEKLAELAFFERYKNAEKNAIILLALHTSIRKNAILKIKYSHIHPHSTKRDFYVIESDELFDKGSMVKNKLIHKSIYDLLISLKTEKDVNDKDSDYIFTLTYDQLHPMMKRLAKKANLPNHGNISFHSIKRAGIDLVHETHGLHAAQMQAGHKSVSTTIRYLNSPTNLAATILSDKTDETIFDELSRDEMLILLKSFGNGTGLQLRSKAKEIIDEREK